MIYRFQGYKVYSYLPCFDVYYRHLGGYWNCVGRLGVCLVIGIKSMSESRIYDDEGHVKNEDIVYHINEEDNITYVNDQWDVFARENSGESVSSEKTLQHPIWDFISDPTTSEIYRQVIKRIRDGQCIRFTFRCDSPGCRRLLEMNIAQGKEGVVVFRTHTISEEKRRPVVLLESGAADGDALLRVCGWCKKVFVSGAWAEVEDAINKLKLFNASRIPSISHGICNGCYQIMNKTLIETG